MRSGAQKVLGNSWITKRANNETKYSYEASAGGLTKPKHVVLLVSCINNCLLLKDIVQGRRRQCRIRCS